MNVVSDSKVIVNVQGIRNVTWGESVDYWMRKGAFFVRVTYKGSNDIFYYQAEQDAATLFDKIRAAMDPAIRRMTTVVD